MTDMLGKDIISMAKLAYQLPTSEAEEKLRVMPQWPSTRILKRMVPIREAVKKLAKEELAELVYMGFVIIMEAGNDKWYPVRTWDFMTGLNSDHMVAVAKNDVELARALKGDRAPIDEML